MVFILQMGPGVLGMGNKPERFSYLPKATRLT